MVLISMNHDTWELIVCWQSSATNSVEILAPNIVTRDDTLKFTRVTTQSVLGAIAYFAGGILVDHGWIRVLGSSHQKINRSLDSWNKAVDSEGYLLFADDIVGGFFAINGGKLPGAVGSVHYFAPDTYQWEDLGQKHSDIILWLFNGDLDQFYEKFRWNNWQKEVEAISSDRAYHFYPFPVTKEFDIQTASRKAISLKELWDFETTFLD